MMLGTLIMIAIGFFLYLAGLIVGLGSVIVIDIHGYLARYSRYWTLTTIRAHKVTKPLIWLGLGAHFFGTVLLHAFAPGVLPWVFWHYGMIAALLVNGTFLSFFISPLLLLREHEGKAQELLPLSLQRSILVSFMISACGWWGIVVLTVLSFTLRTL
jgi:hypothetical protein